MAVFWTEEGQRLRRREVSSEAERCLETEDLGLGFGRTGEMEGSGGGSVDPTAEDEDGEERNLEPISLDFDRWYLDR